MVPVQLAAWCEHVVPAVAEQADQARRAGLLDDHRGARPGGRAVGLGREEVALVDPRAGVDDAGAGRGGPLGRVVLGPGSGAVRVAPDDVAGAEVEAADDLADALEVAAAQGR